MVTLIEWMGREKMGVGQITLSGRFKHKVNVECFRAASLIEARSHGNKHVRDLALGTPD